MYRVWFYAKRCAYLEMIPIVIICYNNHEYVEHMITSIEKINKSYVDNIRILDNNSDRKDTVSFLKNVKCTVYFNYANTGPWISPHNNAHIYNALPDLFVLTDPDLEFHPNMPSTFLEDLEEIHNQFPWTSKIGLALDISEPDKLFDGIYTEDRTIVTHESQFWRTRIHHPTYELYRAPLDTTFCLVNKKVVDHSNNHIRVAGNFTCRHLPWYIENPVLSTYDNYILAKTNSSISTTSRLIVDSIEKKYLCLKKNDEVVLIENKEDQNLEFWRDKFTAWKPKVFQVFDKLLDPYKTCIDIGGWIGTTCIYASRKSKDVVVVEADPNSYRDLVKNCEINGCANIVPIHKAVFHESNRHVSIVGKNDSTSRITLDGIGEPVETITVSDLILANKIDPFNISLIKVDIEGAEEYILDDLFMVHRTYGIPMYIDFHYQFFKNKDLDRFRYLTEQQKDIIRNIPFPSLLFSTESRYHCI